MIEDDKTAADSDRDRKMKARSSFESFGDTSDDDDDEKDTKKTSKQESKEPQPNLFDWLKVDKPAEVETKAEESPDDDAEAVETAPIEQLADDEAQQMVDAYVEARTEDLREDLRAAPEDSVEEAVALADAALLETIQEQGATDDEGLDAALAETVEALELEEEPEAEPEPDQTATAATRSSTARTPPPTPPVPPVPPTPPTPPIPPVPLPAPGPGLPPTGPLAAAGNVMPQPSATGADTWYPNRRRAGDMLLGGAVGYLIGRRRGRIKTEARLMPVQDKLEKQVKGLHDKVAEREATIRRLAAKKAAEQPEAVRPALIQKLEARAEQQRPEPVAEQAPRQPEAPIVRPEALGRFALPRPEAARTPEARLPSIETMTMPDLLAVAERIERDGITVREMYTRGRLDAVGLRRVVHEYLRGDRLDQVLAEYLRPLEPYETLPRSAQGLRDDPATMATGVTMATTDTLPAAQPATQLHQQSEQISTPTIPPAQPHKKLTPNQAGMAVGLATAVVFLLLVLILL